MLRSKAVEYCAVLSNEARFAILGALVNAGQTGLSLRGISLKLDISRSAVKRHIGRLSEAGLVQIERQDRAVICRANTDQLADFLETLRQNFEVDRSPGRRARKRTEPERQSLSDRLRAIDTQKNFS